MQLTQSCCHVQMLRMGLGTHETWEGCEMVRQMAQLDPEVAESLTHEGALWELLRLVIDGTAHLRSRISSCRGAEQGCAVGSIFYVGCVLPSALCTRKVSR